ncbi:hypothetical protein IJH89_02000 [Candidatus Saccharibacteria bacterium]|nr:hypothetical protein [Candidatus Saccharibacteria bacterium]
MGIILTLLIIIFSIFISAGSSPSSDGSLSASSSSYSQSYVSALEQSLESATGDDFTLEINDSYEKYNCKFDVDGSCFWRDYSSKYLTLVISVTNVDNSDLNFSYYAHIPMSGIFWNKTLPDFSSDDYFNARVNSYERDKADAERAAAREAERF